MKHFLLLSGFILTSCMPAVENGKSSLSLTQGNSGSAALQDDRTQPSATGSSGQTAPTTSSLPSPRLPAPQLTSDLAQQTPSSSGPQTPSADLTTSLPQPSPAPINMQSEVTHSGITIYLDGNYDIYEFADGTFGIVVNQNGEVAITSSDPMPSTHLGRVINGAMVNPIAGTDRDAQGNFSPSTYLGSEYTPTGFHEGFEAPAGYDSANLYDASKNAALPLINNQSVILQAGDSYVATKTRLITNTDLASPQYESCDVYGVQNARARIKNVAVFTILSQRPGADGEFLRPGLYGHEKGANGIDRPLIRVSDTIDRALDDSNYTGYWPVLLDKNEPGLNLPNMNTILERASVQPKVIRKSNGWGATYETSCDDISYGRDRAANQIDFALLSVYNFSRDIRKKLLISMAQLGLDNYSRMKGINQFGYVVGAYCSGNGGHCTRDVVSTLAAGRILNNSMMKNVYLDRRSELGVAVTGWQTQMQVNPQLAQFCAGSSTPYIFVHTPNAHIAAFPQLPATSSEDCENYGNNIVIIPLNTTSASYAYCCTANAISGGVALLKVMGLMQYVGNNGLVQYMDWYMNRPESMGWRFWNAWQAQPYYALWNMPAV
jgi:hypothetical protein